MLSRGAASAQRELRDCLGDQCHSSWCKPPLILMIDSSWKERPVGVDAFWWGWNSNSLEWPFFLAYPSLLSCIPKSFPCHFLNCGWRKKRGAKPVAGKSLRTGPLKHCLMGSIWMAAFKFHRFSNYKLANFNQNMWNVILAGYKGWLCSVLGAGAVDFGCGRTPRFGR